MVATCKLQTATRNIETSFLISSSLPLAPHPNTHVRKIVFFNVRFVFMRLKVATMSTKVQVDRESSAIAF